MESKAIARYIHQSPFKVRKTLDSVRGMSVENALNYLHFSKEKAAKVIEKTIRSAVSNLLNENESADVDQGSLKLKEAYVNGGPVMKRFRAASMGRASRLRRPTSHLTVVIKSEEKRI
jgi:large subunit ribosomal protein L22